MATFSKNIKSKYNFETYESTKEAVEWILLSLKKLKLSSQKPKVDFLFDIVLKTKTEIKKVIL